MIALRKVTLAVVLGASLAVLVLAVYLFLDYRQSSRIPMPASNLSDAYSEIRILQDHVDILTRRVGNMELLVMVLLAASGLYALVFALSSLSTTMSFARQADRSIAAIRDQLGVALNDFRRLQDDARKALHPQPRIADETVDHPRQEVRTVVREEMSPEPRASENLELHLDAMLRRMANWNGAGLDSQAKLELQHYESAAAYLELTGKIQLRESLADLYGRFAGLYAASDKTRQRFYLTRALSLVPPDSQAASELHYDLACWFADNRDFSHALGELTLAFQHQSKALDDRLARDIDEGGRLYQLASTPPFEKALNDLLLKMSIGIG
jgi:hypothetical protein